MPQAALAALDAIDAVPDHGDYRVLSDSALWARQRAYFEAQGPAAFASGAVPHQVTSSPDMARALAEVITGFAVDRARSLGHAAGRPLYVVELGAGSGRLGYHMVRALAAAEALTAAGWRPIYVLTDLAEATVAWWQAHPWLAPLFAAGVLDVARFDATRDRALQLRHGDHTISAAAPADELVVIANYVFDSLPHDALEVRDDGLHEWLVADDEPTASDGAAVRWSPRGWRSRPIDLRRDRPPRWRAVLDAYRGVRGHVAFPTGALIALERVEALSRGPLLVLSADKGDVTLTDAVRRARPGVVEHGCVSTTVNYHALGVWAVAGGGTWMHAEHRGHALEVCGFVLGAGRAADVPATVAAFDRAIARRGPDDLHALKRAIIAQAQALSLNELLAYLRLSGHDPKVFSDCAAALPAAVRGADRATRLDLARALERVWDAYLPIGEPLDVAFALGRLHAALGQPGLALRRLEASLALHGERPATRQLIARCQARLPRTVDAALW